MSANGIRVVRDIEIPVNRYPPLDEGQEHLGLSVSELRTLYDHCKTIVRAHRINFPPPGRRERYGERLENSGTLVLPLEEMFPVLKRCKENWGAKWILRKASSAIAVSNGQRDVKQKNEAKKQQLENAAAIGSAFGPRVSIGASFGAHAGIGAHLIDGIVYTAARPNPQANLTLPGLRLSRKDNFPDRHDRDDESDFESDIKTEPGVTKLALRLPLMPKIDVHQNVIASLECSDVDVRKYYSLTDDDKACTALFNESRAWLAGGSVCYKK